MSTISRMPVSEIKELNARIKLSYQGTKLEKIAIERAQFRRAGVQLAELTKVRASFYQRMKHTK